MSLKDTRHNIYLRQSSHAICVGKSLVARMHQIFVLQILVNFFFSYYTVRNVHERTGFVNYHAVSKCFYTLFRLYCVITENHYWVLRSPFAVWGYSENVNFVDWLVKNIFNFGHFLHYFFQIHAYFYIAIVHETSWYKNQ